MSFGPCLCGDLYCSSCGPAQGNLRCPYCGAWDADGGCKDPKACEDQADRDRLADELILGSLDDAADRYWAEKEAEDGAEVYDYAADDLAFDAARERGMR